MDVTARDFIENPYEHYCRLRSNVPVYRSAQWDCWFLASFDDCNRVITDDRYFDSMGHHQLRMMQVAITAGAKSWRTVPAPEMPRRVAEMRREGRRTTGHALGTDAVGALFPPFQRYCAERAVAMVRNSADGSVELMDQFAAPVATSFLAGLLDVRTDEVDIFESWCNGTLSTAGSTGKVSGQRQLWDIFVRKVDERRCRPRDDAISAMIAGPGVHRTDIPPEVAHTEFVVGNCLMISRVTHEGIVRSFSTLVRALATHSEQYQKLYDNRNLLAGAVEEGLRFDTTTQALGRLARTDVELGGVTIPAASMVVALVGSAHRDPAQWEHPDLFEVTREPRANSRHLAFGRGQASCLGATLSRKVLCAMLSAILDVVSEVRLDSGERWVPEFVSRGLSRLPLRVIPAR